jgi:membrane-associated phospholipid phosphatase
MRKNLFTLILLLFVTNVFAENSFGMSPLKLSLSPMNPLAEEAIYQPLTYADEASKAEPDMKPFDFDFFKSKTSDGIRAYEPLDDITFVGVPLFLAGWGIKGDKAMFRVNNKEGKSNTQLLTDFKTGIDDYTQFFGPALVVGMKLGGYEGRSDWPRLLASSAMSYGIMAAFVNGIKYSAKELRPDGSTRNSWPSGHTATSFVGATLLHKEYGLTRSPWFSVAGYGVATATGVMRVLNNRHWVSDVMSGAGLGILSTELGYAIGDMLFKERGLLRNDLMLDSENPSFFSISMGVGLGNKDIGFVEGDIQNKEYYGPDLLAEDPDEEVDEIEFRSSTVVDAEGAYFFNKYVGVGGRLRVRAMSAKSFGQYTDLADLMGYLGWLSISDVYTKYSVNKDMDTYIDRLGMTDLDNPNMALAPVTEIGGVVRSDHMAEFTGSVGLYFNLPLSKHFSLGTKALIGRSITQELDIDGYAKGNVKDIDYEITIKNGDIPKDATGQYNANICYPENTGETYDTTWDFVTLGADNSTSWGTGLSLTYRYKSNFSWKIFFDYDYTKKTYTLKYDPYHFLQNGLTYSAFGMVSMISDAAPFLTPIEYKKVKKMNYCTIGLSFSINL